MKNFPNILFSVAQKVISFTLGLILLCSLILVGIIVYLDSVDLFLLILSLVLIASAGFGIFIIYCKKFSLKLKVLLLVLISVIPRIWWVLYVDSVPVSDFRTMYLSAQQILAGNLSSMRGFAYLSRFPHLIPTTLYMAGMIKIFSQYHLIAMKIVNVILSVLSICLLFVLSGNFLKSDKSKLYVLLFAAIFPPFVSYVSVFCTENIAMPFFLLTLILFFKSEKSENKKYTFLFISGIVLAVSNLFRAVGIIFLAALSIYIAFFSEKGKIKKVVSLTSGFLIFTLIISGLLISLKVIERPLWRGTEPGTAALFLKGTNIESSGMWNSEDAAFVTKHLGDENLSSLCISKGLNRLFNASPQERIVLYSKKFFVQWSSGDFAGTSWAFLGSGTHPRDLTPLPFQFVYIILLILSLRSMSGKNENKFYFFLFVLLGGTVFSFLLIETQPRYSYIVSWIFIILAARGIEIFKNGGEINGKQSSDKQEK